jgi:hypothetical protein
MLLFRHEETHRFISRENFIAGAPKYAIVGVFHYSPTMTENTAGT